MTISSDAKRLIDTVYADRADQAWIEWGSFDALGQFSRNGCGRAGTVLQSVPDDQAVYWCVGLLKPGTGRANDNVERVMVLTIDDVGTKIDREAMEMLAPPPTVKIETSPGNFQWQYGIRGGMAPADYTALRRSMRSHPVWGRSEATAVSNLVRLPMGINGKPGVQWAVRVEEFAS